MKPALLFYPHISSYPVMLVCGFFFGWLLARRRGSGFGIRPGHIDNICLLLPAAALFGARFFARLFYAKVSFFEALKFWEGDGLVFYGGFIFGVAAVSGYGVLRRVPMTALWDCLAPSVALGLAFGRMGCFLAGCCWGDVCLSSAELAGVRDPAVLGRIHTIPALSGAGFPLAVRFPAGSDAFAQHLKLGLVPAGSLRSAPVHPVQLYEAFLAAALAFYLHRKSRRGVNAGAGETSIRFLFGYAAIRFCTEFFRADNKPEYWGLTISQLISVEIAVAAGVLVLFRHLKRETARVSASPAAPGEAIPCKSHPASG